MISISIDASLKAVAPELALGVLCGDVETTQHNPDLWNEIDQEISKVEANLKLEELTNISEIRVLRDAYRTIGKDPSRYRGSQEALLRRILQGKGLYRVNTIVDINNLISLRTKNSVGTYDLKNLKSPICFRVGKEGENYKGIGKEIINIEGLPVFSDQAGPFGSPTSDSERTKITLETTAILMVIISFGGSQFLDQRLNDASDLLQRYASSRPETIETAIVE